LFWTVIGCVTIFCSFRTLADTRAVVSQPPPAPEGAMNSMGFSGYLLAATAGLSPEAAGAVVAAGLELQPTVQRRARPRTTADAD
jgi:hypothetical protein